LEDHYHPEMEKQVFDAAASAPEIRPSHVPVRVLALELKAGMFTGGAVVSGWGPFSPAPLPRGTAKLGVPFAARLSCRKDMATPVASHPFMIILNLPR
jgi:hypothetical protein